MFVSRNALARGGSGYMKSRQGQYGNPLRKGKYNNQSPDSILGLMHGAEFKKGGRDKDSMVVLNKN